MKVAVHSDLHLEFMSDEDLLAYGKSLSESCKYSDVVVLAGDITNLSKFRRHMQFIKVSVNKPIIFVPGNHDFYGDKVFEKALEKLRRCSAEVGISMLYRDSVNIDGVLFSGVTGWSSLDCLGQPDPFDAWHIQRSISDFKCIKGWTVDAMIEESRKDYNYIKTVIGNPGNKVIISHFPPLVELNDSRYPISTLTKYFHNNWASLIASSNAPKYWIYGHTHHSYNPTLNETRFVSNQKGYEKERQAIPYNIDYFLEI